MKNVFVEIDGVRNATLDDLYVLKLFPYKTLHLCFKSMPPNNYNANEITNRRVIIGGLTNLGQRIVHQTASQRINKVESTHLNKKLCSGTRHICPLQNRIHKSIPLHFVIKTI